MMIVDRDGDVKHHVAASGLPLGLIPDTGYDTVEGIPLDPGDVLLLLTDGFREAHKADGVLFGDARVHEVVAAHRNASAADILSALWSAVVDFTGTERQQDDMTGIVARVVDRPPASSSDQGRP